MNTQANLRLAPTKNDQSPTDAIPSLAQEIRAHFVERVRVTPIEHSPFPHMVIESALPDHVYRRILENAEKSEMMTESFGDPTWTEKLRFKTYFQSRFQTHLAKRAENPEDDQTLWAAMDAVFRDATFLAGILDIALPNYLSIRFGDARFSEGFWERFKSEAFTQRHEPGYRLEAHTDIPTRVATMIFSFAQNADFEDAGTALLRPKDPLQVCSGNLHHPMDGFTTVKIAPYRPNTALLFFKTRHSWHSVSPDAHLAPNGRYGMQVQFYEPDGGVLQDLSEPDLLRNKQFKSPSITTRIRWKLEKLFGRG